MRESPLRFKLNSISSLPSHGFPFLPFSAWFPLAMGSSENLGDFRSGLVGKRETASWYGKVQPCYGPLAPETIAFLTVPGNATKALNQN